MATTREKSLFLALCLLVAVLCLAAPVAAANGTITISYRGFGGNYIGDTVILDGINTIGNMTTIRITGPNLPAEGVPPYDLSGTPGSGNMVPVSANGMWTFNWYSSIGDTSKLQTSRYTFIASDISSPEKTATTSIVLKKPEFYIMATPASPGVGDYITLQGMAERGVSYVKIDILDTAGTVLHTFVSPVGNDGTFSYSFHADMSPGLYNVIGSSPSMKNNLAMGLTISAPKTTSATQPAPALTTPVPTGTVTGLETATTVPQTPSRTGIAPATILLALCVFGSLLLIRPGIKKR